MHIKANVFFSIYILFILYIVIITYFESCFNMFLEKVEFLYILLTKRIRRFAIFIKKNYKNKALVKKHRCLFALFIYRLNKKAYGTEAIVAGYHRRVGIFHPITVKVSAALG